MTLPPTKAIVPRILLAALLVFGANAAMAATAQVHKTVKPTRAVHTRQVAAAKHRQVAQRQFDLPGFVAATFGGFAVPLVTQATRAAATHAPAAASNDDNWQVYDQGPAPAVTVDNSQSQAAIEASDQAMQQVDQDTFQMDESVISTEAQDDAANAATQQYMTNNGM
ncbi:MAG: hypothetical protein ABSE22_00275 [Xanthobacteraceae bacterium]|jgi:hypothetical protein